MGTASEWRRWPRPRDDKRNVLRRMGTAYEDGNGLGGWERLKKTAKNGTGRPRWPGRAAKGTERHKRAKTGPGVADGPAVPRRPPKCTKRVQTTTGGRDG